MMLNKAKEIALCTVAEFIDWPALFVSFLGVGLSKFAVWMVVGAKRTAEFASWLRSL